MRAYQAWLLAALVVTGCAPSRYVLNPAYSDARFEARTVRLLPPLDMVVENRADFDDDFGGKGGKALGEPKAVLGRIFNLDLADLTDHARAVYDSAFAIPESGFRDTLLVMPDTNGEHQITFRFPSARGLREAGSESDLALQLEDIRFNRINGSGSSFSVPGPAIQTPAGSMAGPMMGGGGSHGGSLELQGYYILWDYHADAPVSYGRFYSRSPFMYYMDNTDWHKAIEFAAESIVDHSPLKGSKLSRARNPEQSIYGNPGM